MTKKAAVKKLDRQAIRDQLLGHAPKPKTKIMTLFGVDIELRQPTLGGILESQELESGKARATSMIIGYAYVPGTHELIFEDADNDMILNWPFDDDLTQIQLAIAELTGVDIAEAEEVLRGNPLSKRS